MQLFYQTAIIGKRDLPLAPDPRRGFEMTLLRMIAFRPAAESAGAGSVTERRPASDKPAPPAAAATSAPSAAATPLATAAPRPAAGSAPPAGDPWSAIVKDLELSGAGRQLASHCALIGRQGAVVRLALDSRNQLLRTPATEERLVQALSRYFGESVRVEFQSSGAASAETPALIARRASEAELASARRAFDEDPTVKGLRERFGATVLTDTVRPVK